MKKLNLIFCLLLMGSMLIACSPYSDDGFFEPEKTDKYTFDLYQGETGFQLDDTYRINDSQISRVSLESNDGKSITSIAGVYVGDINKIGENKVIVYCHDKMKNIDYYWPRIKVLAKGHLDEYGILIIDYRGYGESKGTPDENGLYADVNTALVWLENQGLTGDRLIMYGYGLGSAVAIELTAKPRSLIPAKIILESPLASIESLIQDTTLQATPRSYISELEFNNAAKIQHITQPIMWIHGTEDKVYNINTQGQLLYDFHRGTENVDKFSRRITGASHDNVPQNFDGGLEAYVLNILSFTALN